MANLNLEPINEKAVKDYIGKSPILGLLAHIYHVKEMPSNFEKISIWVRYNPHKLNNKRRKYLLDFKFTLKHHHLCEDFLEYAKDLKPIEIEDIDRDFYLSFSIKNIANSEIEQIVEKVFSKLHGDFSLVPYDKAKGKIKGGMRFSKKKY